MHTVSVGVKLRQTGNHATKGCSDTPRSTTTERYTAVDDSEIRAAMVAAGDERGGIRPAEPRSPLDARAHFTRLMPMLVSGWQQALTVLLVVVPGFVYQVVRSSVPWPDAR